MSSAISSSSNTAERSGFAITAILTLGLAIGATVAIFSVIDPVLLRPLPYPAASRLAFVWERDRDGGRDNIGFATYQDIATQATTICSLRVPSGGVRSSRSAPPLVPGVGA